VFAWDGVCVRCVALHLLRVCVYLCECVCESVCECLRGMGCV